MKQMLEAHLEFCDFFFDTCPFFLTSEGAVHSDFMRWFDRLKDFIGRAHAHALAHALQEVTIAIEELDRDTFLLKGYWNAFDADRNGRAATG